jgi:hypothetical protein
MNVRTYTRHGDDIWPILTVWLPTGLLTYFVIYSASESLLLALGYGHEIPVELVGGGMSTTVPMTAASYYAGPIGISAMLLVIAAWWYRDSRRST